MATNIVKGAFPEFAGLLSTPRESLLAAPIQAARATQQTPMQAMTGTILGASEQLGQSIGTLFGQKPAAVAQQDKLKEVVIRAQASGKDLSTPEGLLALAQELERDPEFVGMALSLRQQAAEMVTKANERALAARKTESEIQENIAQARKYSQEQSPFGKINPADFTPASLSKFAKSGSWSDLVYNEKARGTEGKFDAAARWNSEIDAATTFLRNNKIDPNKPLPPNQAVLPGFTDAYRKAQRPRWDPSSPSPGGPALKPTAVPLPANPSPQTLVVGTTYQTARGPATWNGTAFIPVGQ